MSLSALLTDLLTTPGWRRAPTHADDAVPLVPGPENKELNVLIAAIGPIPELIVQPCNSDDLRHRVTQTELVDVDAFIRDGYVVVRGAFDVGTAAACRAVIWDSMSGQGIREDDPATWPPLVEFDDLVGEPFTAAGTSPALVSACNELIGPGRWTAPVNPGGAVVVRFPSEGRANAGYHIEGSYDGPGGYWVNVRSRARGLLALFLFSDVGLDDAPTRLVCGSHLYVPEFLASFGETGSNADAVFWRPSVLCRSVAHATGRAGDVFLCHPFLIHTATWPHRGTVARMIAQPVVHAQEEFAIDGSDPSPVARAIVAGLAMGRSIPP